MNPGINFEGADEELQRLGNAVVAFMREVSESAEGDVETMLVALQRWGGPVEGLSQVDLAVLKAVLATLRIRLNTRLLLVGSEAGGMAISPLLADFDVTGLPRN